MVRGTLIKVHKTSKEHLIVASVGSHAAKIVIETVEKMEEKTEGFQRMEITMNSET
jgi:hypothetical protein